MSSAVSADEGGALFVPHNHHASPPSQQGQSCDHHHHVQQQLSDRMPQCGAVGSASSGGTIGVVSEANDDNAMRLLLSRGGGGAGSCSTIRYNDDGDDGGEGEGNHSAAGDGEPFSSGGDRVDFGYSRGRVNDNNGDDDEEDELSTAQHRLVMPIPKPPMRPSRVLMPHVAAAMMRRPQQHGQGAEADAGRAVPSSPSSQPLSSLSPTTEATPYRMWGGGCAALLPAAVVGVSAVTAASPSTTTPLARVAAASPRSGSSGSRRKSVARHQNDRSVPSDGHIHNVSVASSCADPAPAASPFLAPPPHRRANNNSSSNNNSTCSSTMVGSIHHHPIATMFRFRPASAPTATARRIVSSGIGGRAADGDTSSAGARRPPSAAPAEERVGVVGGPQPSGGAAALRNVLTGPLIVAVPASGVDTPRNQKQDGKAVIGEPHTQQIPTTMAGKGEEGHSDGISHRCKLHRFVPSFGGGVTIGGSSNTGSGGACCTSAEGRWDTSSVMSAAVSLIDGINTVQRLKGALRRMAGGGGGDGDGPSHHYMYAYPIMVEDALRGPIQGDTRYGRSAWPVVMHIGPEVSERDDHHSGGCGHHDDGATRKNAAGECGALPPTISAFTTAATQQQAPMSGGGGSSSIADLVRHQQRQQHVHQQHRLLGSSAASNGGSGVSSPRNHRQPAAASSIRPASAASSRSRVSNPQPLASTPRAATSSSSSSPLMVRAGATRTVMATTDRHHQQGPPPPRHYSISTNPYYRMQADPICGAAANANASTNLSITSLRRRSTAVAAARIASSLATPLSAARQRNSTNTACSTASSPPPSPLEGGGSPFRRRLSSASSTASPLRRPSSHLFTLGDEQQWGDRGGSSITSSQPTPPEEEAEESRRARALLVAEVAAYSVFIPFAKAFNLSLAGLEPAEMRAVMAALAQEGGGKGGAAAGGAGKGRGWPQPCSSDAHVPHRHVKHHPGRPIYSAAASSGARPSNPRYRLAEGGSRGFTAGSYAASRGSLWSSCKDDGSGGDDSSSPPPNGPTAQHPNPIHPPPPPLERVLAYSDDVAVIDVKIALPAVATTDGSCEAPPPPVTHANAILSARVDSPPMCLVGGGGGGNTLPHTSPPSALLAAHRRLLVADAFAHYTLEKSHRTLVIEIMSYCTGAAAEGGGGSCRPLVVAVHTNTSIAENEEEGTDGAPPTPTLLAPSPSSSSPSIPFGALLNGQRDGIRRIVRAHQCNDLCRHLGLGPMVIH